MSNSLSTIILRVISTLMHLQIYNMHNIFIKVKILTHSIEVLYVNDWVCSLIEIYKKKL